MTSNRHIEVDFLRGVAIVLMAIFHLCFDLYNFRFIEINLQDTFWFTFRIIIITIFFSMVGVSLVLAYQNGIDWKKFQKRLAVLFAASAAITLATYFVFPKSWIYFGVLHFIFFASIAGLLFIHRPNLSLVLGIVLFLLYYNTEWFNLKWLFAWLQPVLELPEHTVDIVRFIPWFGMVLFGIFLAHHNLLGLKIVSNRVTEGIAFLGKHSLFIYLTHQIVLFSLVWSVWYLLN